jgi:hypothetical protein
MRALLLAALLPPPYIYICRSVAIVPRSRKADDRMNKKTMDQKAVRVCVIQFSVKNLKSV